MITIYSTQHCPYCMAAKELLASKGIEFEEIDLTENPDLREDLSKKHEYRTVPMIFIGEEFIGGFQELQQRASAGQI